MKFEEPATGLVSLARQLPPHDLTRLISAGRIAERVASLAIEVESATGGRPLVAVIVLKGAFLFAADLLRRLRGIEAIDFLQLSSYGTEMETSGNLVLKKDIALAIHGRDVLLVEDIIDTGWTLDFLVRHLRGKGARSIRSCVLLDKPVRRRIAIGPDHVGFEIDNHFVVGYGLDWSEQYRELPDIYRVSIAEGDPTTLEGDD